MQMQNTQTFQPFKKKVKAESIYKIYLNVKLECLGLEKKGLNEQQL